MKWLRPVRPGDTLSGTATVLSARLSAKRPTLGIARLGTAIRNQADETVLELEYTLLLLTREGAAA